MPLVQGSSRSAIAENIHRLSGEIGKSSHVQSHAQAVAIALATARRNTKRAGGGKINGYDDGGAVQSVIKALTQGGGSGGMFGSPIGGNNQTAPNSAPNSAPQLGTSAASALTQRPSTANNSGVSPTVSATTAPMGVAGQGPPTSAPTSNQDYAQPTVSPNYTPPPPPLPDNYTTTSNGVPPPAPTLSNVMQTSTNQGGVGMTTPNGVAPMEPMGAQLMNRGGTAKRASGGFNMARSPHLDASWQTRQEARSMMHTGPILSAVPGRTDNHRTQVPSGSYVLPAQHVASMGQGNSVAGLSLANTMFGGGGPYGAGSMKIGHGPGAPRPPRPGRFADGGGESEGGARGEGDHVPVDVMLSGGEFVISPESVRRIGKGSLKNGHKILDAWVMATRKKEIETQRKLPPPAKK